jgi:hypothetical protein
MLKCTFNSRNNKQEYVKTNMRIYALRNNDLQHYCKFFTSKKQGYSFYVAKSI